MRIIYYCPEADCPKGGIKVIYAHCRLLNRMGVASYMLHERKGGGCRWISGEAPAITAEELHPADHLIIPEVNAAEVAGKLAPLGLKYSIFVQNGHYLRERDGKLRDEDIDRAYLGAELVLSISDSTSALIALHYPQVAQRIVRMVCSVDPALFRAAPDKSELITYMPRKNAEHAAAVVYALGKRLPPSWRVQAIERLPEAQVAQLLGRSRIFLSFSDLEGLGLPPIEAALCGNYVLGYHGGGGLEYWQPPNFEAVEVGQVVEFVDKVLARVAAIEAQPSTEALAPGIACLRQQYSEDGENAALRQLLARLRPATMDQARGFSGADLRAARLQKRAKFRAWPALGRRNPR